MHSNPRVIVASALAKRGFNELTNESTTGNTGGVAWYGVSCIGEYSMGVCHGTV